MMGPQEERLIQDQTLTLDICPRVTKDIAGRQTVWQRNSLDSLTG